MLLKSKLIFEFKFVTYPSERNDEFAVFSKIVYEILDVSVDGPVVPEEIRLLARS